MYLALEDGPPITAEAILAFEIVWPELEPSIKRFARTITGNREDRRDLVQEAMIALWKCDPARFDFRDASEVAYVRRILINHMWDAWGRDRSARRKRRVLEHQGGLGTTDLAEQLGRVGV